MYFSDVNHACCVNCITASAGVVCRQAGIISINCTNDTLCKYPNHKYLVRVVHVNYSYGLLRVRSLSFIILICMHTSVLLSLISPPPPPPLQIIIHPLATIFIHRLLGFVPRYLPWSIILKINKQ